MNKTANAGGEKKLGEFFKKHNCTPAEIDSLTSYYMAMKIQSNFTLFTMMAATSSLFK